MEAAPSTQRPVPPTRPSAPSVGEELSTAAAAAAPALVMQPGLARTSSSAALQRARERREQIAVRSPGSVRSRRAGGLREAQNTPNAAVATPDARRYAPAVQLPGDRYETTMPRDSERAWLAAAEQQLHAREQALEEKLAAFDKQWDRLQRRQEEVVQRESAVGQLEAAVVAGAGVLQQLGALGATVLANSGNGSARSPTDSRSHAAGTVIEAEIDRLLELCGPTLRGPLGDASKSVRDFLRSLPSG